jgi:hypothetical protein
MMQCRRAGDIYLLDGELQILIGMNLALWLFKAISGTNFRIIRRPPDHQNPRHSSAEEVAEVKPHFPRVTGNTLYFAQYRPAKPVSGTLQQTTSATSSSRR